jgi:hypothetical protein
MWLRRGNQPGSICLKGLVLRARLRGDNRNLQVIISVHSCVNLRSPRRRRSTRTPRVGERATTATPIPAPLAGRSSAQAT